MPSLLDLDFTSFTFDFRFLSPPSSSPLCVDYLCRVVSTLHINTPSSGLVKRLGNCGPIFSSDFLRAFVRPPDDMRACYATAVFLIFVFSCAFSPSSPLQLTLSPPPTSTTLPLRQRRPLPPHSASTASRLANADPLSESPPRHRLKTLARRHRSPTSPLLPFHPSCAFSIARELGLSLSRTPPNALARSLRLGSSK